MKIKRISLRNFQSHVNTTFDLEDFTILVGESSSGKTSILRAIDWLLYGAWDKTYPNDKDTETAVAIVLSNGSLIARFRKGDKQWAAIKNSDGVAMPFKDFGEYIPGIFDLVRARPIELGNRTVNLNISRQGDPAFMVHDSWSKPAKAQWLGRLYGAHVLTHMMKAMSAGKRVQEAEARRSAAQAAEQQARYNELSGVDTALGSLKEIKASTERLAALEIVMDMYREVLEDVSSVQKTEPLLNIDTQSLREDIFKLEAMRGCLMDSISMKDEHRELQSRAGLLSVDLETLRKDLEYVSVLKEIRSDLNYTENEAVIDEKELKLIKKKHKKLSDNLKESLMADGKCPLCLTKKRISGERLGQNLNRLREVIGD